MPIFLVEDPNNSSAWSDAASDLASIARAALTFDPNVLRNIPGVMFVSPWVEVDLNGSTITNPLVSITDPDGNPRTIPTGAYPYHRMSFTRQFAQGADKGE